MYASGVMLNRFKVKWKEVKVRKANLLIISLMLAGPTLADCKLPDLTSDGITGFQEAVISVSDLDAAFDTWRDVGHFETLCDGPVEPGLAAFWGLPSDTRIHEVVLRKGRGNRGLVRLVQIYGLPQIQIRSSGMPWDTGGFFDLYVYVRNVDQVFYQLRARGWQGYNDPTSYTLQQFNIREAIMRGPDGEVLVLMQRNAPPYDKVAAGSESGMGWPFNVAMLVKDFAANERFFGEVLGWTVQLSGGSTTPSPGDNPLGIPTNLAQSTTRLFAAYAPHPMDRNGSLQVLMTEGLEGRDFSFRTEPPNLGILTVRVPAPDLPAFAEGLAAKGMPLHAPITTLNLPPYGPVSILALKAPNGARIEFFAQK